MSDREEWLRKQFHNVLLATDFHQNSKLALRYAAELVHRFGGKLTVLNAFEFGPYSQTVEVLDHVPSMERRNAKELLNEFTLGAGPLDVLTEQIVVEGLVPSAIIKALYEFDVNLLVIGTEGMHRGFDHLLLGSNTEALMLGSHRPTLTVGPRVPERLEHETFQKIIYISDFSVASTAAATFANLLEQAFQTTTEVYQLVSKAALKDAERLANTAAQYCDMLRFADPDLPMEWFDPEFQLSRILPEADLIAKVSEPSNLIVLGVQPASFIQRHLHTSLAYRLLANAASPVLTIPAETARQARKG
ncbi:universal stress protein [Terriglobus saanensis]|uniref:UspA domain-containing protein n=1 Tax=Terriglobus saanensis (strain ATCC BAA-1853 / DSM 23119 / SP1PR4) TaxID=401053 RepID=E8V6H6_TERSS|nr:universal stress protein [Terriglobus saanensis]ADV82715.1 UspA domain-containing protein [Terriglobus saanensis SP1PR4]